MFSNLSSSNFAAEAWVTGANPSPGRSQLAPYPVRSGTGWTEGFVTRSDGGIGINAYIAGGTGVSGTVPVSQTQLTTQDVNDATPALPVRVITTFESRGAFGAQRTVQDIPGVDLSFHYSINPYFVFTSSSGGGTVSHSGSHAVLSTSTGSTDLAHLHSRIGVRYTPGQGITARFTALFSGTSSGDSLREIGIGDEHDGFFFVISGSNFGILRRSNDVDYFISQSDWNGGNRFDGTGGNGVALTLSNGNVYGVRYQWLGYGAIRFLVEDPANGTMDVVHTIHYTNRNTDTSIRNPTLPLHARCLNRGNTSPLSLRTPSMGAYTEGRPQTRGALGSTGSSVNTTNEAPVFSILCTGTFQGVLSRVQVQLMKMGVASGGGAVGIFRVLHNATLTSASFQPFDLTSSVVAVDLVATAFSGGREVYRTRVGANQSVSEPLADLDLQISPGDTLTFTARSGAGATTFFVDSAWKEEFSG